jgi:hypothetical protein
MDDAVRPSKENFDRILQRSARLTSSNKKKYLGASLMNARQLMGEMTHEA